MANLKAKIGDAKRHALFATTRTRERERYRRMGRAREEDLREVRYKYKPEELSLKYSVPFGIASKNSHSNPEDLTGGGLSTRSGGGFLIHPSFPTSDGRLNHAKLG